MKAVLKRMLLLALMPAVVACMTPRGQTAQSGIEETLERAAIPYAVPEPPAEVATALLPDLELEARQKALPEERFDVDSRNTAAREFFMGLVEGTPYNVVVHPDVRGNISLNLKNVTVMEVLKTVRDVYGYDFRSTAAGFIVLPATLQSRIFQVDYLNLQRAGVSSTRVSSGQVSQAQGDKDGSRRAHDQDTGRNGRDSQQVTGTRIDTNYAADFWAELEITLKMVVGNGEGRQVVVNTQTGVIVVRAMASELREVARYLETVQSTAQRQVILEAKIIEVQLKDGFQAGVNWAVLAQNSSGDSFFFGQTAPTGPFSGDLSDLGGSPITVEPGTVTSGFDTSTIGSAFAMAFDIGDFNAFIELLEVQGDTRVLSSPRVSTLNNQKAVIKAGTDEFFVTDISSNTVTGTAASTSTDVELTPFFSGIALDVTPQISKTGEVILHIHPTVSEVVDQEKMLTIAGETDILPLAFSEVRESDSIVKARSGQIIVIGGLMRNSTKEEVFSTPVLGRIPGLGALFRSERQITRKTELVILLKPVVADDPKAWADIAEESLERVRGFTTP